MIDPTLSSLFKYSDLANSLVLRAAYSVSSARLDEEIDIGPSPGSLRRILIHTLNGETVWLARWQGKIETPWPNERAQTSLDELTESFSTNALARDTYLAALTPAALDAVQVYRDSKGTRFQATLRNMLLQGLTHSTHHRAQATNAIRRLGGSPPELDYMSQVRVPAIA